MGRCRCVGVVREVCGEVCSEVLYWGGVDGVLL